MVHECCSRAQVIDVHSLYAARTAFLSTQRESLAIDTFLSILAAIFCMIPFCYLAGGSAMYSCSDPRVCHQCHGARCEAADCVGLIACCCLHRSGLRPDCLIRDYSGVAKLHVFCVVRAGAYEVSPVVGMY